MGPLTEMGETGGVLDETFRIALPIDLIAAAVGSLQGAMFAAGFKRIDLLGVAMIGIFSGIGGGFLRDVLLGISPAAFSDNLYLIVGTLAAFAGMLLARLLEKVDPVITVFDAMSIGIFGALGTTKALAFGLPVVPSLFIGTVAAVGGGVLRDLMLNIPIALMHVGSLYAVASLAGVGTLVVLLSFGVPVMTAGVVCVIVTAVLRLLAVRFGWSLPEQRTLSRIRLRRQRQVEQAVEEALATGAITLPISLPDTEEATESTPRTRPTSLPPTFPATPPSALDDDGPGPRGPVTP